MARRHWAGGLAVAAGLPHPGALPAVPHSVSWTLIPLRHRRQLVGVIAVAAADYLARRFAARVVRPLQSCLLAAELHAASLAAAQSVDLEGTLRAILAGVRRVVPADAASVLVREGDHARVVAVDGHPTEALGHLLRISQDVSLEGPLLRGEAVRLDHLRCDYDDAPAGADKIRGYLGAPLLCGDEVVGILCIDSWVVGAFGAEDAACVELFAGYVAAALQNARLHEAVPAHMQRPPATRIRAGEEGRPALPLRVSVGLACFPGDGESRDTLVARADARLYESKGRGAVRGNDAEGAEILDAPSPRRRVA